MIKPSWLQPSSDAPNPFFPDMNFGVRKVQFFTSYREEATAYISFPSKPSPTKENYFQIIHSVEDSSEVDEPNNNHFFLTFRLLATVHSQYCIADAYTKQIGTNFWNSRHVSSKTEII